jgi:hypothetical protein
MRLHMGPFAVTLIKTSAEISVTFLLEQNVGFCVEDRSEATYALVNKHSLRNHSFCLRVGRGIRAISPSEAAATGPTPRNRRETPARAAKMQA